MEYFPQLELGSTSTMISFCLLACVCLIFVLLCIFLIYRKKNPIAVIVVISIAFLLIIPCWIIVDMYLGGIIFDKYHSSKNNHMPEPSICLYYHHNDREHRLMAQYQVSPNVLKKWIEKYSLKQISDNKFASKIAPNGQLLWATYDPQKQVLSITYWADGLMVERQLFVKYKGSRGPYPMEPIPDPDGVMH